LIIAIKYRYIELGIIPAENNKFNPKRSVTYTEFVTSAVRFARKAVEMDVEF